MDEKSVSWEKSTLHFGPRWHAKDQGHIHTSQNVQKALDANISRSRASRIWNQAGVAFKPGHRSGKLRSPNVRTRLSPFENQGHCKILSLSSSSCSLTAFFGEVLEAREPYMRRKNDWQSPAGSFETKREDSMSSAGSYSCRLQLSMERAGVLKATTKSAKPNQFIWAFLLIKLQSEWTKMNPALILLSQFYGQMGR